ncbi:hypothetical protein FH972_020265 [Carpinus fangiana]|uniref:Phase-change related protein n=1 Tax=Carpinus fangiana TaxID=176857 RepID=A0A5N6RUU7_9ROSI|nr:hypothetical protein FH972_020265 [Carpinus fangiana]
MGYSKTFLLLGLVFAVVLFISSHVSARELLAEPAQNGEKAETDSVGEDKHGGHHHEHHYDHHHHGGHHGHD